MKIEVEGLRALVLDLGKMDVEIKRELNRGLVRAGQPIVDDARARLSRYPHSERSVSGLRARTAGAGVLIVEQRRKRVTGKHPEWGSLQMKEALLPAAYANMEKTADLIEEAIVGLSEVHGF